MSAAALRYAARRTVGVGGRAFHRTRAAVEEEQRRRFIHSGTPLSKGENEALKNATEWQVEQMKEELFTAMTEQKQHNSEYAHYRLLEHLSGQIEPRPNDPRWLWNIALATRRKQIQRAERRLFRGNKRQASASV